MAETATVVWLLEHDGYGTTIHVTSDHAKASAEHREHGGTYWRWDDDVYRLKRSGETIATIRPVEVLGSGPSAADHAT